MGRRTTVAALVLATVAVAATFVARAQHEERSPTEARRHAVAPPFVPDDTTVSECLEANATDTPGCLAQAFGNVAFESGAPDALGQLDRQRGTDAAIERSCHRIAHAIGAASLARAGGDVGRALATEGATCAHGYYHGVVDYALVAVPADSRVPHAAGLCDGVRDPAVHRACVHGVGHALVIASGFDLETAVDACSELPASSTQVCAGGAFMEAFSVLRDRGDDAPPRSAAPCQRLDRALGRTCFRAYGGGAISGSQPATWPRRAQRCDRVGAMASACWTAVGETVAEDSAHDIAAILSTCRASRRNEVDCIAGAAWFERTPWGRGDQRLCGAVRAALRPACLDRERSRS